MIKVVAGIIRNQDKVLVCQRKAEALHPLKWEFPGGKISKTETPETGLKRELAEELNITAEIGGLIYSNNYAYNGEFPFKLFFFEVKDYQGKIKNRVFENIKWVKDSELKKFDLLEGDLEFVDFFINRHKFQIDFLQKEYKKLQKRIKDRLKFFKNVKPSDYFYELVYCILTPQSSAVNADFAVRLLKKNNFYKRNLNPERFLHNKDTYIRFHKNKARYLSEMKNKYDLILNQLKNTSSTQPLREWFVQNIKGIGYKEASHFLRNIGYRDLAILDRHILRNLHRVGVLNKLPKSLSRKNYLDIEQKFKVFSEEIKIPLDELDLLFWSMETGKILR